MTVKEVAQVKGLTVHAIYKMIKQKRDVGKHFVYRAGKGWTIEARLVRSK